MTSQGYGCSRWFVAGGDDVVLLMVARKTVPTAAVCKRSDILNFVYIFYFLIVFFVFTIFGIPEIEGSLSESGWFVVFFCFNLSLHFLVACLLQNLFLISSSGVVRLRRMLRLS